MKDCRFVNGSNVTTAGRSKMPDSPLKAHGILGHRTSDLVFSVVSSRFNTGDGIHRIDCQQTSWTALHLFENDGFGLQECLDKPDNHPFNILTNLILKANRAGNYKIFSPSTHIGHSVLDSGELRLADHGPIVC